MDKAKKKRIKRYITWLCMAGVVVLLTVMPLLAKSEAEKDGPQASILSATVESGSITTALHGGGTLEDELEEGVIIPTKVKITGFLVKNGDIVKEGTPVATVDKTSVMAAITSVNETMKYLREELEDGRNEKVDSTITAVPGGRVKKIFAKEGETVQEVMLRDGALAVLSIDSMMAVQFETASALGTGENVDVVLEDGTAISGWVESNLDGVVVITVDDEGYEVGQQVTVEGLGSGTLYIHNAWKATGYAGTISRVYAKEEQTLGAGANLFTLEDREFEGQLQHRANQHREYEELLQELLEMYQSGTIDAPCEGLISGVDSDSIHLLASNGEWTVELLNNTTPAYRIVFLSDTDGQTPEPVLDPNHPNCKNSDTCPALAGEHMDDCPMKCTTNEGCDVQYHETNCITHCKKADQAAGCTASKHYLDCIHSCDHGDDTVKCDGKKHYPDCIEKCNPALGENCPAMKIHKKTCLKRCSRATLNDPPCDAEGKHYINCIESCTEKEDCPASVHKTTCLLYNMTFTAFPAKVFAVGNGKLVTYASSQSYYVERTGSGWTPTDGAKIDESLMVNLLEVSVANPASFREGDVILIIQGQRGTETWSGIELYRRTAAPSMDFDMSGMMDEMLAGMMGQLDLSGMMGGFAGFGNYSGMTTQETENLHDLEGSTLLTVTPHRTMKLTATFDEQDISKIQVGMEAHVKVEALKNQQFTGTVTEVGIQGTNNGGSSKFTATITINASENMISGMSASAAVPLETKENILILPVAALYEQDGKTIVYTGLDKDSGEPADPVEVVTGISDGEYAEVVSGLAQGASVYYSYYDTLELDTSAQAEKFTFG